MTTKKLAIFIIAFIAILCSSSLLHAQEKKTVTGTVKNEKGEPIASAAVTEKGTKNGTLTDEAGVFTLKVAPNAKVEISAIGYVKIEESITGKSTINPILKSDGGAQLSDVVVTALGIKKQRKSLGYAVQEIKGQTVTDAKEVNLVNDLSGKVAGLQVTRAGGGPTSSSKITLRGNNSLTGDNQPLIVVDGVPMQNSTGRYGIGATNDFWNPSYDMGNGLSDMNADDIESISVLKGPAAAALYGSRAGNGAILITTKSGKKQPGIGITVSSSVGFESMFAHPDIQTTFGQGDASNFIATSTSSWGPKIAGQTVTDWTGASVPLKSYNNLRNFYSTGVVSNENVSFQQQVNSTSVYASYNRLENTSMIPGQKLTRNNLLGRTVTKFGKDDRWTLDTKIQYTNAVANNRSLNGENANNTFANLYSFPVSLDITSFKKSTDVNGNMIWYVKNGVNPYWSTNYNLNDDSRDRFLLYGSLKYQFTNWLTAEINGGSDMYTTNTETKLYGGSPASTTGSYSLGKQTWQETDYSTLITAKKDKLFGKFGGTVTLGGNLMAQKNSAISASAGTLRVPNLFTLNNSVGYPTVSQAFSQKKINSLYGSIELNYDDYLFLTGTFRNDWSSALSKANRSYFYPSVTASYVFSDMITKNGGYLPSWFSYGKLRASYAAVGNDLGPYQLYNTYYIGTDPWGNTVASSNSTLFDPNVRSELIKSYEAGVELRFFRDRLGLDVALYKSNATNQIIYLPMDPLSGYSNRIINAGNIQNKGIEATVDARILTNPKKLNWTLGVNFSTNNNTVVSLYPGITQYALGGYDNIQVLAVSGAKYGEIYGTQIQRITDPKDANYGQLLLNSSGLPQDNGGTIIRLGNQQASALFGITNTFSYKGFSLSFLIDARLGGKIFSGTLDAMERAGTAAVTLGDGNRDSMVVKGVISNGSGGYVTNTKRVSTEQYWNAVAGVDNLGITETNLYDASNVRIRNVQLSYAVPHKYLDKTKVFQKAIISVSCNNVWLISSHMHGLDPESVYATGTNAIGFENGSAPTSRIFYINLTLGF